MKRAIPFLVLLLSITISEAQNHSVETQSVTLENLITFIADYFPAETSAQNANKNKPKVVEQISVLIETSEHKFALEDKIMLQQAFRFLSKRLSDSDKISIVVYSKMNGSLLELESPKSLKKILYAIDHINTDLTTAAQDGITLAYQKAEEHYNQQARNTVVMVRNPHANSDTNVAKASLNTLVETNVVDKTKPEKAKSNMVLLTAITLLPELIALIKN